MEYMKKLKKKIENLGRGLESMRLDSHSVKAKIGSRISSSDDNESCNSQSHKRGKLVKRHERIINELRKNPWDLIKDKIQPFTWNGNELKVAQNLDCIKCENLTKVKLIALSLEGYALIRDMRRISIESWEELK
ncbi:hypothetical protein CR513_17034, partial [Mucuna pruriens]